MGTVRHIKVGTIKVPRPAREGASIPTVEYVLKAVPMAATIVSTMPAGKPSYKVPPVPEVIAVACPKASRPPPPTLKARTVTPAAFSAAMVSAVEGPG